MKIFKPIARFEKLRDDYKYSHNYRKELNNFRDSYLRGYVDSIKDLYEQDEVTKDYMIWIYEEANELEHQIDLLFRYQ